MKKITALIAVLANLLIFSSLAYSQEPLDVLLKKLDTYTKKFPQEKVHLHLDKPYYAIGDDIWFKAYVVDAKVPEPALLSQVLNVELIGEDNLIKKELRLPIKNGTTSGYFKLSDTLTEGNYRIRAYTEWMRNAGPDFFFDKMIKIGNSWSNKISTKTSFSTHKVEGIEYIDATISITDDKGKDMPKIDLSYQINYGSKTLITDKIKSNDKGEVRISFPTPINQDIMGKIKISLDLGKGNKVVKSIPIKFVSDAIDVQFFPEGGNLVQGLVSKVGIKAINSIGLGLDVSGKIFDNTGTEITSFQTTHLGMGSFFFNPQAGKTYNAKVISSNGSTTHSFPEAKISGAVLAINNIDTAILGIKLTISPDLLNKGDLNLVIHKNGQELLATKMPSTKQLTKIELRKDQFPSGILQLSLFNSQNIPIAERILFINNPSNNINLNIEPTTTSFNKKEKVELVLSSIIENEPVEGNFSVAVTNITPDNDNESNILTNLLLTSELKGFVEKPNYYFTNNNQKTREDLDNLLLTQGWRKINWTLITGDQYPEAIFKPQKGIKISGTITKNNKSLPNSKVALINKSNGFSILEVLSDVNGKFTFEDLSFSDSTKFVLQARSEKDNKDVLINLDKPTNELTNSNKNLPEIEININFTLKGYLDASNLNFEELTKKGLLSRTILLKEVEIEKEKKTILPYSENLNGPGNADQIIDVTQLDLANSVGAYLQGRILNVEIRNGLALNGRNNNEPPPGKNFEDIAMTIVLDGMPMGKDYKLADLYPQNIASIEVLISPPKLAIYGPNGANGLLIVTSKRGSKADNSISTTPGITSFIANGYQKKRAFYSPKYDVKQDIRPDLRTTVFWEPNLTTDEKGQAKISYNNTDKPGIYRVVIEGMDLFGNLARQIYTYQVK